MDADQEEAYLQNIEEYVMDQASVVTYKSLSKLLNIHVNLSKQLLRTFACDKSRKNDVWLTYLLSGQLRETGGYFVTVVGQDQYHETKAKFKPLVSDHVYSVQKAKQTPLPDVLYNTDCQAKNESGDLQKLPAIQCKYSIRRTEDELSRLKISVCPPSAPSNANAKKTAPAASTAKAEKKSPTKSPQKAAAKDENASKAKGGIAAMFAAQSSKATSKEGAASSAGPASKGKAAPKKGAGISNFFNKVSSESAKEKPEQKKSEEPKEIATEKVTASQKQSSSKSKDKAEDKSAPSKAKANKRKSGKKSSEKKNVKQRKRIISIESDSSDDDIFGKDESSSREPSPEREPTPPPPAPMTVESDEEPAPSNKSDSNRRRKRRKVTKDKTYMEDGYVVTKKVTEYESYSDSEPEVTEVKKPKSEVKPEEPVKNNNKQQPAKSSEKAASKLTSPTKFKQKSLTSFFKKV